MYGRLSGWARLKGRKTVALVIAVEVLVGTVVALVVAVGITSADASKSPTASSTQVAAVSSVSRHGREHLIENPRLRRDILALRGLDADERRAAWRQIKRDALAGEYGHRVQAKAERIVERRATIWALLPQRLRDDILALRDVGVDARSEARQEIFDAALAGEYGKRVQAVAERIHRYHPAFPR